MDSKAKRGQRQRENSLPNTIVIQLVSPQPHTMPISVHAMPLLPESKTPVEQTRRPAPLAPNSPRSPIAPCPSRMQSAMGPPSRIRAPIDEIGYSSPQFMYANSDHTNQPLGQGRTVWMEYVYHPGQNVAPIYSSPLRAEQEGTVGHCVCNNYRCARRSIQEPENFMENQTLPRLSDFPQSRQESASTEGRRDQATNTDDQPQHLESLKVICETLGQAIVAAATAAVETAHKLYTPNDCLPKPKLTTSNKTECRADQAQEKKNISSSIEMIDVSESASKVHIKFPKTPRTTIAPPPWLPQPLDSDEERMESGSSPTGVYIKSRQIIPQRPNSSTGSLPVRKCPMVKQNISARVKGREGPAIRRRFPTEEQPPVKQEEKSGPTSPNALIIKQLKVVGPSPPDLTVVTLPPDPDLSSYSQTDDPCLSNKI
ncbi:uncharacterized protein [Drosophila kikkawai]|uniref:Uncharacterized protein n=1 Tax=Drosophila kikkawai TaxID=30033 RepID=A0A6P4IIC2_DROKI|nr:uncharacterized protein LOC108074826 [Drosophila kikkawai]